jgi:hypothetical protein
MKLVHLVGFITKEFVAMHGHVNVKKNGKNSLLNVIIYELTRRLIPKGINFNHFCC